MTIAKVPLVLRDLGHGREATLSVTMIGTVEERIVAR
jgi:hypothetical protein